MPVTSDKIIKITNIITKISKLGTTNIIKTESMSFLCQIILAMTSEINYIKNKEKEKKNGKIKKL